MPFSPEEEIDKLMKMPVDWGVETVEAGVDVFLYGRKNDEPAVNDASESLPI